MVIMFHESKQNEGKVNILRIVCNVICMMYMELFVVLTKPLLDFRRSQTNENCRAPVSFMEETRHKHDILYRCRLQIRVGLFISLLDFTFIY